MRKGVDIYRVPTDLSHPENVATLNRILQNLGDRLDTIQQVGATAPPPVTGLTVTGKQGVICLTWQRIQNVDGYIILGAAESTMSQIVLRFNVPDSDTCTYSHPVGNVAVQYYFTVSAYQGNLVGQPSNTIAATSVAYTSVGTAPPIPPQAPRGGTLVPRNGTTL